MFTLLIDLLALDLAARGRVLKAENVKTMNAGLGTSELIESNQKQVNDIYLGTVAKDVGIFTPAQATQLFAIANQCPMLGGNAVFRARALYSLIDDTQKSSPRRGASASGSVPQVHRRDAECTEKNGHPE